MMKNRFTKLTGSILVLVTLLVLISAAAFAQESACGPMTLADMPPVDRYAISAAIGKDREDYHLEAAANAYCARNTNHGLIADLEWNRLRIRAGETRFAMTVDGFGFGNRIEAVLPPIRRTVTANRIEYQRRGLVEWYVNGPLGLQQGFTIRRGPLDAQAVEAVVVQSIQGDLRPVVDPDGKGLKLVDARGPFRIRYAGLCAFDAGGRHLDASLEADGRTVRIRVKVSDALYPVVIDPIFEQSRLLVSGAPAYENLGVSISASGGTVVVGADANGWGAAYVFEKPSGGWNGTLVQSAKLLPSDRFPSDNFACSVSIDGDTIVVGSQYDDDKGSSSGSAYVFVKPPGGWSGTLTQTAKLLAHDGIAYDNFGCAVSMSGDTIVVGVRGDDDAYMNSGSACVFVKPAGGWSGVLNETGKLLARDRESYDDFGSAVSINGDTVVVGSKNDDDKGYSSGSAYVFVKPPGGWSGTHVHTAKLLALDGDAYDSFGNSVSMSGDTIAVGAYWDDDNGADSGSAYVFEKPPGGWSGTLTESAKLVPTDGANRDFFGYSVAISGETVLVGAYGDDDKGTDSGSAYLFVKPPSGWSGTQSQTEKLLVSDGGFNNRLGWSVSLDCETAVAGALGYDGNATDSGGAFAFDLVRLAGSGSSRPGGTMNLALTAFADAGLTYQVASSFSTGSIPVDTRVIRLYPDWLFLFSVWNVLPSIFTDYTGTISTGGNARAAIHIPVESVLVGCEIHSAFVTLDTAAPSGIRSISSPYAFRITM